MRIERSAPAAESFFQFFERNCLQLADRFDAERLQSGFGDFADAGNSAHGERREKCASLPGGNPDEAARLGLIARDFCDEARGAKPAGARQARGRGDFEQKFVSGGERRSVQAFGAGEIEIGFVDRGHFDDRRKLSRESWRRDRSIRRRAVVAVEKNCVGAKLPSGAQRHRGMDAEFPRFVARRGNHAALIGLAAHDYRLAAQFRSLQQLDRNEERVHIDMQNRSVRIRGSLQRGVVLCAETGPASASPSWKQLYNERSRERRGQNEMCALIRSCEVQDRSAAMTRGMPARSLVTLTFTHAG